MSPNDVSPLAAPNYDPALTTSHFLDDLLTLARLAGHEQEVARHLVGAWLRLRFPYAASGEPYNGSMFAETEDRGDFQLNDTIFYVRDCPSIKVCQTCREQVLRGWRVCLLVPDKVLPGARRMTEAFAPGSVSVTAIPSFLGLSIDMLSLDTGEPVSRLIRRVLEMYNSRVEALDFDPAPPIAFQEA